ncbi:MAG: choice-of-anchor D domain-containing protein, partial [Usitatibacteraceae bacterium]
TITITNSGTSNLNISSIANGNVIAFKDTVNGPPPQAAHYCGFGSDAAGAPLTGGPIVIAPLATCNLVIVFNPNTAGSISGTITIVSDAPTSPTSIVLTGTGVAAPTATLTPNPLDFGNVTVGATSATLTATFTNPSATPLQLSAITTAPPFAVTGGTCVTGNTIAAGGGSCTVTMTATPTVVNVTSSALQVFTTPLSNNPLVNVLVNGVAAAAPVVTSPATASGVVGSSFTYQIVATNGPTSFGATGLPPGLTVNTGTGQITGTPTAAGTTGATITATNANGTGSLGLSITITAAPVAPVITSGAAPAGTVGTPYSFAFTATGTTPITWTLATGTLPPGLTLNPATGVLSGTPTASGAFGFLVQAANGTAPNATQNISITINAPSPAVTLAPPTVAFGARTVNTTSPVTPVTLTNSGGGGLVISSIVGSGDYGFTTTCPISTPPLAAGANCAINITFTPLTVAAIPGAITITSNAPGSPHTVALSGTGTAVAVPGIGLSPASLSFGPQTVNTTSAVGSVIVTNTGFANLTLSAVTVSAPFARVSLLAPVPPECAASVAPGSSCQIGVVFTPTAIAPFTGQITITDNAAGSPHTVPLSGTGTALPVAVIAASAGIGFGDQILNTTGTQTSVVSNTGTAPLNVSAITLSGTNAANFTLAGQSACATIAPSGSCTLTLTFTPTSTGAKTAQINFTSNAQNAATVNTQTLTGNGILAPRAVVNVTTTAIGFGNVIFGGATPSQNITLTNTGGQTMNIAGIAATGDFLQVNNCGTSLASLASCTINVRFTPLGQGSRAGEIIINSNATTSPDRIPLSGTGCRWFSQSQSRLFLTAC